MFESEGFCQFLFQVRNSQKLGKKFTPLITSELRRQRFGKAGESWYVDETVVRVKGKGIKDLSRFRGNQEFL